MSADSGATSLSHGATAWLRRRRWDLLALGVVLAVVLFVQFRYLRAPWLYDPADYFHSATQWPDVFLHHRPLRVGLVLPVRAAQAVFGVSEAAWYAVPFASVVLLSASTYAIGRMLFGIAVGMLSAILVVLNPYVLTWSAQIFPDLPSAALFAAAVALLIRVGQRRRGGKALDRADLILLVGAGLLLGWAYLVREFIVFLFPVLLAIALLYRLRWRAIFVVGGAAATVFAGELVFNALVYGDPLVRIREMVDKAPLATQRQIDRAVAGRPATSAVTQITVPIRLLWRASPGPWFVGLLAIGPLGLLVDRRRRALPLLIWILTVWLVLVAVGMVRINGRGLLRPTLIRYWYPVFPPLLVAGLGTLYVAAKRWRWEAAVAVTAGVGLLTGVAAVGAVERLPGTYLAGADELRELRAHLDSTKPPPSVMWTDGRLGRVLDIYRSGPFGGDVWDGQVRWLNNARQFRGAHVFSAGELVTIDDEFFRPRHSNYRGAVPAWLLEFPEDWDVRWVAENSQLVLFEVGDGDDTRVTEPLPWATNWTVLPRAGDTLTGRTPLSADGLSLRTGDHALLVDGAAATVTAGSGGLPIRAGSYLRFKLPIAASGGGNVVPRCMVYDDEGTRHDVHVVSTWGVPAEFGTMGGVCRAPTDGTIRLALEATGPLELRLGTAQEAWVDVDGEDGRT